jgi:hypothetical protein
MDQKELVADRVSQVQAVARRSTVVRARRLPMLRRRSH